MTRAVDVDYLVVGAGAMGMAFTDALVEHADVRVALVDRRHGVGGHWLAAYPFVRLHQASAFYGVASTLLGGGRLQETGPEAGLQERASVSEILAYFDRVLAERLLPTGRVEVFTSCEYDGERGFVSRLSGERYAVPPACRVVDARYLAPEIPQEKPAPFAVDGARVVPVNQLVAVEQAPEEYVVVGSGKTAMDACVWLLDRGVDPDAICWVRPRDPWMLNRAVVQPDPAVFLGMTADILASAEAASSLEDLFARLEEAGVMLRVDRSVVPTMARTPTLAPWELTHLRSIENVVRLGHVRAVSSGRVELDDGSVSVAADALVVHCAASGLQTPPLRPIWSPGGMTLQLVRSGFPCFAAALVGYVEATRDDDDEKNRLCPPTPYSDGLGAWATMTLRGARATRSFGAEPDIKAWADTVALNPARVPPGHPGSAALSDAQERIARHLDSGLARLAELTAAG